MTSRGFDFSHLPVLYEAALEGLSIRSDGLYVDCTAGGGGHSEGILRRLGPRGRLIALDRDDVAVDEVSRRLAVDLPSGPDQGIPSRCVVRSDFSALDTVLADLGVDRVDGILADLGVSSPQLDSADRGFSYQKDGPLDMRMDRSASLTAADVVNRYPVERLASILKDYGEERHAARIARAIGVARARTPIRTTGELAALVASAMPPAGRREAQHPAKRSFQAIRIEVNGELAALERLLAIAPDLLSHGGRMVVISFHSLEDRRVKDAFRRWQDPCRCPRDFPVCVCGLRSLGRVVTPKPLAASEGEAASNPRARSARLRIFERNREEAAA